MKKLFLDIETLPAPDNFQEILRFLHAKKKKKKEEDFEQYLLRTSFDGAFGRILCLGYAFDNEEVKILYEQGDEKEILKKFWGIAKTADLFVGHNIMDFDLRFIYQRSVALGVRPTRELSFARYKSEPIFDTMKEWVKWAPKDDIGLEALALALGLDSPKQGIDGSQVYIFYKNRRIREILDYCKADVETTRAIYKKMRFEDAIYP